MEWKFTREYMGAHSPDLRSERTPFTWGDLSKTARDKSAEAEGLKTHREKPKVIKE